MFRKKSDRRRSSASGRSKFLHSRSLAVEPLEDRRLMAFAVGANLSTGTQLTTYTLALASTAEFTQAAGGKAAALAVMNNFVTELNKIYEPELAISFTLHPQNDKIIFENAATDGFSNGVNGTMLGEGPTVINTAFNGNPNTDSGYDFGHVLGIGTDGGLGGTGAKASGASNLARAEASEGNVGLLAHEIGHQMSANHTLNGNQAQCANNRNTSSSMEPGSGSTIMSYQGTCGGDNLTVLPGDERYFHAVSFDEIISFTTNIIPQRGLITPTGNNLPTVNAGADRTIPAGTPFTLTAVAADPDAVDNLTYTWEQTDLSNAAVQLPVADIMDGSGPLFRSFAPSPQATRVFPRLETIVANTPANQNRDEHLPTQSREMNFRVTVRDNHQFNGKTVSGIRSDDVKLTVVNTGAPFRVTSFNTQNQSIAGGSQQTVTWDIAGTDASGINTSKVDILLSVDGGLTYPITLLSQTNNDGNESVSIPNVQVGKARIKVQADPTQNVFFDINDADIQINQNLNVSGGVVVTESGGSTKLAEGLFIQTGLSQLDTYTIALTKPPTGAVTINITADAQTLVSLDGTTFTNTRTVTFAAGDAAAKTVTVKAIDDLLPEGFHKGTIRHAVAASADANYSPQVLTSNLLHAVSAHVSDDEAAPLIAVDLDFAGPNPTVPANWNRIENPFAVDRKNLVRENGDATTADLAIAIANPAGAGWSEFTMDRNTIPRHSPAIEPISDSMYWEDSAITATWSDLRPNAKYRVYVFAASEVQANNDGPINQTVAITGKGNDNPAPFVQNGTGKVTGTGQNKTLHLFVNGTVGSSANNLEQYGLLVTSTADGKITINVTPAAGSPAVVSGFAVQESFEPTPGITVVESDGKTEVSEAGTTDTFTVQLDSAPTANVVLDLTSVNTNEVTVDKASVTFTPANWNVPQTVTVAGVDDNSIDGDQTTAVNVTVNLLQSDPNYATVARKTVVVTTKDNEQPGFTKVETNGKTEVSETGSTDTFTVVLTAQPAANVVFKVDSADLGEATVDKTALTFTPATWNVPQTVTVTGIDDTFADGNQVTNVTLSLDAAASDPRFGAVPGQVIAVTTTDNEQVGFSIVESTAKTEVTEAGSTDSFTVVLTGRPATDVVLNLVSGNTGEATLDRATLTFTTANWDQAQTVTATGVDDQKVDGNVNSTTTVSVDVALSDAAFRPLANKTVVITTTDDDQAGFLVTETGTTEVNESGTTDTFTVVLLKQPISDVVFNVTSGNTTEATVDKATLTFTTANWNTAQTVTVRGVQDNKVDGNQAAVVAVAVDGTKSQAQFGALAAQNVSVTVVDSGVIRVWQNGANRFDVSGDGAVVPLDALRIINELNDAKYRDSQGKLPDQRPNDASYYDVNGDGFATTNDALQVINLLNAQGNPEGEASDFFAGLGQFLANEDSESDPLESLLDEIAREHHGSKS